MANTLSFASGKRFGIGRQMVLAYFCLLASNMALADITLGFLKERVPKLDWAALEKGEIVWMALPKAEMDDAALVTVTAVKLPVARERVLEKLHAYNNEILKLTLDTHSDASVRNSLNAFRIAERNDVNVDWFLKPRADGTYNVSKKELALLEKNAANIAGKKLALPQARLQIERVIQDILANRVNEYRKGGLDAISTYYIDGKEIHPGSYLANSLEPLAFLQEKEPLFLQAFSHYPANQKSSYEQDFYLGMEIDENRPITSLKHWLVDTREQLTLIAERKFYISHSLDAMHTLILVLEQDKSSYVFLLNQTFTEKVTGIGSFIAHKVGRSKVKQNIMPMFEHLHGEFNYLADASPHNE